MKHYAFFDPAIGGLHVPLLCCCLNEHQSSRGTDLAEALPFGSHCRAAAGPLHPKEEVVINGVHGSGLDTYFAAKDFAQHLLQLEV